MSVLTSNTIAHFLRPCLQLHKVQELTLVLPPVALVLPICIQNILCGRKVQKVLIVDAEDGFGKVTKVITFGKASELRNIVQSHIHKTPDARVLQLSSTLSIGIEGLSAGQRRGQLIGSDLISSERCPMPDVAPAIMTVRGPSRRCSRGACLPM
jgi:hypothetical protein